MKEKIINLKVQLNYRTLNKEILIEEEEKRFLTSISTKIKTDTTMFGKVSKIKDSNKSVFWELKLI